MKRLAILLICFAMLLTACGDKENVRKVQKPSISLFQEIMDATLAQAREEEAGTPAYLLEMDRRTIVKVLRFEEIEEGYVIADVLVVAPDLYSVVTNLQNVQFASTDEMDQALTKAVKSAQQIESELQIDFYLEDDVWTPTLTEEFADACYGGLLTYRQEYYEQMEGVQ